MYLALRMVREERERQHTQRDEQNLSMEHYGSLLMEEVGEFFTEANDLRYGGKPDDNRTPHERRLAMRNELIQVAAMAVQMVECIHREIDREANNAR